MAFHQIKLNRLESPIPWHASQWCRRIVLGCNRRKLETLLWKLKLGLQWPFCNFTVAWSPSAPVVSRNFMLATLWKVPIWFRNFSRVVCLNLKRSSLNNTQKYLKKYSERSKCVRVLYKKEPILLGQSSAKQHGKLRQKKVFIGNRTRDQKSRRQWK